MRPTFIHTALAASCLLFSSNVLAQTAAHKPAPHKPAAHATSKGLSAEQLAIADMVTTGRISCGDGHSVTITPDAKIQGAFDLKFGSTKYDVEPVSTKSGAIRLEDRKTGIVFMQLANKSMLFNERAGKRLADDCISPNQQVVADQLNSQIGTGLLDGPSR
jgi:hypothetical protein